MENEKEYEAILDTSTRYRILEPNEAPKEGEVVVYHEVRWEHITEEGGFVHCFRETEPKWVQDAVPLRRCAIYAHIEEHENTEEYKVFRLAVFPDEIWCGTVNDSFELMTDTPRPELIGPYLRSLILLSEIHISTDKQYYYDPEQD